MLPDLDLTRSREFETGAEREIIDRDTRRLVLDSEVSSAPFRFICNLEYNFPGVGWAAMCSGTLIGPRTVLTAGHCLDGLDATRMRVTPGRNGSFRPFPTVMATRLIIFPGFHDVTVTDIGIIHLREDIGTTVGYWGIDYRRTSIDPLGTSMSSRLPLPAGSLPVNISGYPSDKPGNPTNPPPTLRRGSRGSNVADLQIRLNAWLQRNPSGGFTALRVDGVFGEHTDRAVRTFQSRNGLGVDGVAGRQTWGALPRLGCRDTSSVVTRCRGTGLDNPSRDLTICGKYQYRSFDLTVRVASGMLLYTNDTCPGHSGSPVWVRRAASMGGRVLVAVHVGGGDRANRGVLINDQVLSFIRANWR